MDATLVLGQQGRLVIPADVRATLGLAPGIASICTSAVRVSCWNCLRTRSPSCAALSARVPKERSLVEEVLAERRTAAAAE